jgi:hypothetical protein
MAPTNLNGLWEMASLFRSQGVENYQEIANIAQAATLGRVTSFIPDSDPTVNVIDEFTTISVRLLHGTLESVTLEEMLNGANLGLFGTEYIRFRDVAGPSGPSNNEYVLSGLLRGRYGTHPLGQDHKVNEAFVLLEEGKVGRVMQQFAEIGQTRNYRGVTSGLTIDQAIQQTFKNTGRGLKPFAPVKHANKLPYDPIKKDIHIAFFRCPRYNSEWIDFVDAPQVEMTERYEVEVRRTSDDVLLRTLTGTNPNMDGALNYSDGCMVYLEQEQINDFGYTVASEEVYFVIYQLSPLVGRGYPLTVLFEI